MIKIAWKGVTYECDTPKEAWELGAAMNGAPHAAPHVALAPKIARTPPRMAPIKPTISPKAHAANFKTITALTYKGLRALAQNPHGMTAQALAASMGKTSTKMGGFFKYFGVHTRRTGRTYIKRMEVDGQTYWVPTSHFGSLYERAMKAKILAEHHGRPLTDAERLELVENTNA